MRQNKLEVLCVFMIGIAVSAVFAIILYGVLIMFDAVAAPRRVVVSTVQPTPTPSPTPLPRMVDVITSSATEVILVDQHGRYWISRRTPDTGWTPLRLTGGCEERGSDE